MSAPLRFDVPPGADLLPDTPMLGWRLEGVCALDVRPGQFTTFDGYRCNVGVEVLTETTGRGSKKHTSITGVRFTRSDGAAVTLPRHDKKGLFDNLVVYAR